MEKTKNVRLTVEVVEALKKLKRPGQTYDGALRELLFKKAQ